MDLLRIVVTLIIYAVVAGVIVFLAAILLLFSVPFWAPIIALFDSMVVGYVPLYGLGIFL